MTEKEWAVFGLAALRRGAAYGFAAAGLFAGMMVGAAFAQTAPDQTTQQEEAQPSYTGSITVPQDLSGQTEVEEAAKLASLARISADQARAAALAGFPGATVQNVELGNENGTLIFSVQLVDKGGQAQDVKVDAGNGAVLQVEPVGAGEEKETVSDQALSMSALLRVPSSPQMSSAAAAPGSSNGSNDNASNNDENGGGDNNEQNSNESDTGADVQQEGDFQGEH